VPEQFPTDTPSERPLVASGQRDLGWQPRHDFAHVLRSLREGRDFRSQLARDVGSKGYHAEAFGDGPYPVA